MATSYAVNDIKYGWEQETTIGTALKTTAILALTTEREIDFALGVNQRNIRKARGLSYQKTGDGQDFRKTNQVPTVTLPYEGCSDILIQPLATLFQGVTIAGGGPYVYTFNPYAGGEHSIVLGNASTLYARSIYKKNDSVGTYGEYISGGITRSITLGSKEDEPLLVSDEIVGMTLDSQENIAALTYTDLGKAVLLHSDLTFTLGGAAIEVISWQVKITNNAYSRHYQNQTPQKHILGPLDVTIDLVIPWSTTDYKAAVKANTDYLFEVYKGSKTGATAEDFYLQCNFAPQDVPQSADNEEKVITFTGTGAHDGTNPAIQIIAATLGSRLTSRA